MSVLVRNKHTISIHSRNKKIMLVSIVLIILISLSFFPNIMGLSFTSSPVYSYGMIEYPGNVIYWSADFEEGTGIDWTRDFGGDEVTSAGTITYVSSNPIPYKGSFSMKSWTPTTQTVRRAKGGRRTEPYQLTEAYYGGAVYIPPGFSRQSNDWCQIMELHYPGGGGNPAKGDRYADIEVLQDGSNLVIEFSHRINPSATKQLLWTSSPITTGAWYTWVVYLKIGNPNGELKFWWDNSVEASPDFSDIGDYDLETDPPGTYFNAGLYRGPNDTNELWVAHDNLIAADTFEIVVDYLS